MWGESQESLIDDIDDVDDDLLPDDTGSELSDLVLLDDGESLASLPIQLDRLVEKVSTPSQGVSDHLPSLVASCRLRPASS